MFTVGLSVTPVKGVGSNFLTKHPTEDMLNFVKVYSEM